MVAVIFKEWKGSKMSKQQVVILGAGYAGLKTLRELQKGNQEIEITLVDRNSYHYEATDLHEVATGTQPATKICYNISDVVDKKLTNFIQGTVEKIDSASQKVYLANGQTIAYDYLVVALGFESESFGIPGVQEYALQMVDVKTAENIHEHIQAQMRQYKETKNEAYLKIVVCGAGFTGIELLGALVENKTKFAQLAGVTADKIQLYCVEAVTRLLPMFSEKLADYGVQLLKDWQIHLLLGKPIKEIKPDTVIYQSNEAGDLAELSAKTIIWTTGVSGSHVVGDSGFEARRGRVMVQPDLTDPHHNNVYIIGDCSAVMDQTTNRPYPTTAQIALKMGAHAAKNIQAQMKGEATKPFRFQSQGSVCSVGNTHALGVVGKAEIKGYPASLMKKMIMNKSLFETGGVKEMMAKGRFDLYH